MDISKNIISIREKLKIKQSEIAKELGVEPSNYSRLEKRGSKLSLEQITQIAKVFGMTATELINYGKDESALHHKYINEIETLKEENRELRQQLDFAREKIRLLEINLQDKSLIMSLLIDEKKNTPLSYPASCDKEGADGIDKVK